MTPESEWRAALARLEPGDVESVICTTWRDDDGVFFDVSVSLKSLARHAFEHGEDMLRLWSAEEAYRPNIESWGARTWAMAREQDRIASEVWSLKP